MKITANSLRLGNIIEYKGRLYVVAKSPEHIKPGKGGAYVQVELKDLQNGTKLNERLHSSGDVERVQMEEHKYQYLYADEQFLHLMNTEDFEQIQINKEQLEDKIAYLKEGMNLTVESCEGKIIRVVLPDTVVLKVQETEPTIKGQTASASYKPAIMDNGLRILVPPFIDAGVKVIVRTEDNSYVERCK